TLYEEPHIAAVEMEGTPSTPCPEAKAVTKTHPTPDTEGEAEGEGKEAAKESKKERLRRERASADGATWVHLYTWFMPNTAEYRVRVAFQAPPVRGVKGERGQSEEASLDVTKYFTERGEFIETAFTADVKALVSGFKSAHMAKAHQQ
ncbi:hypothetical protein KIPB_003037, partial [Kipferlia bialata]